MNASKLKTPGVVTAAYDFQSTTPDGDYIFSIKAGIPLRNAFDQLSVLVSSSISALELAAVADTDGSVPGAIWQTVHQLGVAYALIQAMHSGEIEYRTGTEV